MAGTALAQTNEDTETNPACLVMRRASGDVSWERVYVFISSTFNDMHGERDYLVKEVFPQLADWCEARRLRMVDIDLRWGVTEQDATRNRNVVQVCLRRIDECRPFFVCLLGQRYGWVPSAADVSTETFSGFPGLAEAVGDRRSVTELEILHAIVHPFSGSPNPTRSDHAFFYQRHPASLRGLGKDLHLLRRMYSDRDEQDEGARRFLLSRRQALRKQTIPATGRSVAVYRSTWDPLARTPELELPLECPAVLPENVERWRRQWKEVGIEADEKSVDRSDESQSKAREFNRRLTAGRLSNFTSGVESLASRIQRDLREAIEARFPGRVPRELDTALALESEQQEQFQFSAAEGFVERAGDFDELDSYASEPADRPLVITAPGGAGKSMLLARWIDRMTRAGPAAIDGTLIFRFIGASDGSTSVSSVLELVAREILDATERTSEAVPADPVRLRQVWPDLLREAGARVPLCIVIDALDQLHSGLSDLTWIPSRLPPGVRFIVSFRGDAPRADIALARFRQIGARIAHVRPFAELDDRRRLVRAYLEQYLKELDEAHLEALIEIPGAENPLFLKVALGELRVFGSFSGLRQRISSDFGTTPQSAFDAVLRRLESDPTYAAIEPEQAIPVIFGVLAHARRGLSAAELANLLCAATGTDRKDPLAFASATGSTYLALRQVRPHIARRQGRFDFFYETFRLAAIARYGDAGVGTNAGARTSGEWNALLSDYFAGLSLWNGTGAARTPNVRKVSELPYHLTMAADAKRLGKTLADIEFIEAKCAAGLTFDLIEDYSRVPPPLATPQLDQFADFARANAHILSRWPELTFQQAANTVTASVDGQAAPAKAAVYRQVMGLESRPWIRRLNPSPTASACIATYSGHDGSVISVGVTPDGARILSAGSDGSLRVWDRATSGSIEIARGMAEGPAGFVMIPNTSLVAVAGPSNRILLWNFDQLQTVEELEGTTFDITSLAADATGRWLIAGTSSTGVNEPRPSSVVMYDLTTRSRLASCHFPDGAGSVALGDGGTTAYLAKGSAIVALDVLTGRAKKTMRLDTENITRIRVHPNGRAIAVGQWGGRVTVHDGESLAETLRLPGTQAISQDVVFSPDGTELAVAGMDGTIKFWNRDAECLTTLRGHSGLVTGVSYTPDGNSVVTSSVDGTIKVWNPQFDRDFFARARVSLSGQLAMLTKGLEPVRASALRETVLHAMHSSRKHANSVTGVAPAASNRAVTASIDDTLRIWNLDTGECERALEGHEEGIWSLATSRSGATIASADRAATMKLWDVATGSALATQSLDHRAKETGGNFGQQLFREMQRPTISPLRFSPDSQTLYSADSLDRDIKAWDAGTLALKFKLAGHTTRIRELLLQADGRGLISTSESGEVIVWDTVTRSITARGGPMAQGVVSGQLGPAAMTSGGAIACAWMDGTVRLLDPASLSPIRTIGEPGPRIRSISSGRDILAIERSDGNETVVELWRESHWEQLDVRRFDSPFIKCAFHESGRRIAMGGPGEPLTICDIDRGNRIRRYPEPVNHIAFTGDRIVAGNEIGEVFLLEPVG